MVALQASAPRRRAPIRFRVRRAAAAGAAAVLFASVAAFPLAANADTVSTDGSAAARTDGTQRLRALQAPDIGPFLAAVEAEREAVAASPVGISLQQFLFSGVVNWGGYRFTYYSQQVLPGGGLTIPGRHVNEGGFVSDGDGFIVLAGSAALGTVYDTPFGAQGKIYDRGTSGNHLDVYIR